jgi:hypothetical protein
MLKSRSFGCGAVLAVLLIVAACGASPFRDDPDKDRVFSMAEEGDATAQTALGLMYERGLGVSADLDRALDWYRKAAVQGDPLAAFHLGSLYERGEGVEPDYRLAALWYQRAAAKGNDAAQAALAYLYERGLGVDRNFRHAEALYGQAAEQWSSTQAFPAEAAFALGRSAPQTAPRGPLQATAETPPANPIDIDLGALDDAPPPARELDFDGPAPIAGTGEYFPGNEAAMPINPDTPGEVTPTQARARAPRPRVDPRPVEPLPFTKQEAAQLSDALRYQPARRYAINLSSNVHTVTLTQEWKRLRRLYADELGPLTLLSNQSEPGGGLVALNAGPLASADAAKALCAALQAKGQFCQPIAF